eukprot:SAG31_NODE_28295_length_412_cov_0.811502_1_plen_95_part_10
MPCRRPTSWLQRVPFLVLEALVLARPLVSAAVSEQAQESPAAVHSEVRRLDGAPYQQTSNVTILSSRAPVVLTIDDLFTDQECAHVIEVATPKLK